MAAQASADMIAFDLAGLAEPAEGMATKVLAETGAARVVLVILPAGTELPEQRTSVQLMVQSLRGRVLFCAGRLTRPLASATLLLVEERVPYSARALEDSALLFTYTPSPASAGEDTTSFAGLLAYVERRPPARPRTPARAFSGRPRRTLPVLGRAKADQE